jgi:hypothetical protein
LSHGRLARFLPVGQLGHLYPEILNQPTVTALNRDSALLQIVERWLTEERQSPALLAAQQRLEQQRAAQDPAVLTTVEQMAMSTKTDKYYNYWN